MKRFLVTAVLIFASVPIQAQHRHPHGYATGAPHYHRHHSHNSWVAPLIVGGVIGYAITRNHNEAIVVQQPPVVYTQMPNCSAWIETIQPDGTIVRQRTCTQ